MDDRATLEEPRTKSRRLVPSEWQAVGLGSGLLGGATLALPTVLWDWARSAHLAFELPMAATAWLFGLQHFSHATYHPWPVVIGIALLAGYAALSGLVFTGLADRVFGITGTLQSVAAGLAWAFVSFVFFWDMLLPIARDGAPFRATSGTPNLFIAPNWAWILGFTLLGLVTGACYAGLRESPADDDVRQERPVTRPRLERAA